MKRTILMVLFLALLLPLPAQNIRVSGTVNDREGLPVTGAGVFIKGTTVGTTTAPDGTFSLAEVPPDAVLTVSSIGYDTIDIPVEGRRILDIVLDEEVVVLDDVMVVAYGTARKESFTGSAAVVKGDDLITHGSQIQSNRVGDGVIVLHQ